MNREELNAMKEKAEAGGKFLVEAWEILGLVEMAERGLELDEFRERVGKLLLDHEGDVPRMAIRRVLGLTAFMVDGEDVTDSIHPEGHCLCHGEGRCLLCRAHRADLAEAELEAIRKVDASGLFVYLIEDHDVTSAFIAAGFSDALACWRRLLEQAVEIGNMDASDLEGYEPVTVQRVDVEEIFFSEAAVLAARESSLETRVRREAAIDLLGEIANELRAALKSTPTGDAAFRPMSERLARIEALLEEDRSP